MLTLDRAGPGDCREIHEMQVLAFKDLLDRYKDTGTNPGAEPLSRIVQRMWQWNTDYYFICLGKRHIGAIRVVRTAHGRARIAPMFLLPEFQGKGYAQQAICEIEKNYPDTTLWELDTIKQESKLCHLYEKMGYLPTGREEELQDGMTIIYYEKHLLR